MNTQALPMRQCVVVDGKRIYRKANGSGVIEEKRCSSRVVYCWSALIDYYP